MFRTTIIVLVLTGCVVAKPRAGLVKRDDTAEAAPPPPPPSDESEALVKRDDTAEAAPPPPPPSDENEALVKRFPRAGLAKRSDAAEEILERTNYYRALHGSPALTIDTTIQASAAAFCSKLASENDFYHSNSGYGENLYAAWGTSASDVPNESVDAWYNEIDSYNWDYPGYSSSTGHFTQLVWKGTEKLGCSVTDASENVYGSIYACCQYYPAGNVLGNFEENVPELQ